MKLLSHPEILRAYMRKGITYFFTTSNKTYWFCHLAFWFPLVFATPLFIATNNRDDVKLSIVVLAGGLALLTSVCVLVSHSLTRMLGDRWYRLFSLLFLAVAIVLVVQGNIVHDQFYYGAFDAAEVNWRAYGWKFWVECWTFFLAILLAFGVLVARKRLSAIVPLILMGSCIVFLAPAILSFVRSTLIEISSGRGFDDRVFEFSSDKNLIHLLPDGFQGDLVREILKEHPDLAEDFTGFTVFSNHVGLFQATAPTISTIYNGRPFDPSLGYKYKRVKESFRDYAYQNYLDDAGYRMDFVPAGGAYCIDRAATCVVKSFNDGKTRGYFKSKNDSPLHSLRVLADLTLFRHLPMYLKEHIYNEGNWLILDTTFVREGLFPDPVIREWTENIKVADGPPRYKWYHYIGIHTPPRWDNACNFVRKLKRVRDNYKQQTHCVLAGIAQFLNKLKDKDIYDQTAIVISGDHGIYIPSQDITGDLNNDLIYSRRFFSIARPAFMVKELSNSEPLRFSELPTSIIDVAPTALDLVGLSGDFEGVSAFSLSPGLQRERNFNFINMKHFWSGDAIPYDEFQINGRASDASSWKLSDIQTIDAAPTGYPNLSCSKAAKFTRGLELKCNDPSSSDAWIRGREFAFLISLPEKKFAMLKLQLHIPESVTEQSVSVNLNGRTIVDAHPVIAAESFWTEVSLPVESSSFRAKNNFVSVVFEKSVARSKGGNEVSGLLGSIEYF